MSPEDSRHGTYAGAVAHWVEGGRPCPECFTAETRYRKARKLKHLRGEMVTFPAIGITRRITALHALGWAGPAIAAEAGISINTLRRSATTAQGSSTHAPHSAVIAAFDRLCMTRPEGHYANRTRAMARRRGWPPPLAYDDIDNPDEQPQGVAEPEPANAVAKAAQKTIERTHYLEHANDHRHTLARVSADLGITEDALWTWCRRNGRGDLWEAFKAREKDWAEATNRRVA